MSTGRFIWYDLMTTEVVEARAFYTSVFGWDCREHGPEYWMIHVDGQAIGGMVHMDASHGAPNHWIAYVTTDDFSGTVAKVREQGGRVYFEKAIEGLGEFAVIADRQGAVISPFQMTNEPPPKSVAKAMNFISWAELHTSDPDDALAFYQALFGWKSQSWGSDYYLVGDEHSGGIMKGHGGPPSWLLYVNVASTDSTAEAAVAAGGQVLVGPRDIPRIGRFAVFVDPTGAVFAVMQSFSRE